MNVLNATVNLLDPVVTWKGDGSAGLQQTRLSLQTVEDSSNGAVASLQLGDDCWFCVVSPVHTRTGPFILFSQG